MFKIKQLFPVALLCGMLFSAACSEHQSKQKPQAKNYKVVKRGSADALADTVCFINVQGRDTVKVSLHINKGDVSGYMVSIPYEKDRRRGKLAATKQGDIISGDWMYMQEGVNDTLPVKFRLTGNTLQQQPWKADMKTGREVADPQAPFSIAFQQTECHATRH